MRRHYSEVLAEATLDDIIIFIAARQLQEEEAEREQKIAKQRASNRTRLHHR